MSEPRRHVFFGVLLVSLSMLVLETLLPRIFAVYVGPNFVYFSISIALVGLGSGGLIASVWEEKFARQPESHLFRLALWFSIATFLAIWVTHLAGNLLNDVIDERYAAILATTKGGPITIFSRASAAPSMLFVLVTGIVMAVPFLIAGLCISLAFRYYPREIGRLYAYDLFGAGLGCVFTVASLTWFSATNGAILISVFSAAAALLFSLLSEARRRNLRASMVLLALLAGCLAWGATIGPLFEFRIHKYAHLRSFHDGPTTETEYKWTPLGRIGLLSRMWSPPWNETPQVRMKHMVAMDLGGHSVIETFAPENLEVIKRTSVFSDDIVEPIVVPGFYRENLLNYLVLMAGNGQDMMRAYAWYGDQIQLEGVELNPAVYELGFDHPEARLKEFFSKPNVRMHIDEGRSFVEKSKEKFDLILLSYSGATFATGTGSLASTPQFLFTREAMLTYLQQLNPGGVLVIAGGTSPNGLPDSLWTFAGALAEFNSSADVRRHVLSYRRTGATQSEYYVIYHRDPLAPEEIDRIRGILASHNLELTFSESTPSPHSRLEELRNRASRAHVPPPWPFQPLAEDRVHTDDRPFYYFNLQWGSVGGYLVMGYLATFFSAFLVAVLFLLVPLFVRRRAKGVGEGVHWYYFLAFALLGAGFMLIEVGSIQKFELFLGSPQLTLAVILASLLIFTGVGSFYSRRLYDSGIFSLRRASILVLLYGAAILFFLNRMIYHFMDLGLGLKMIVIGVVLFPLGFLLGTFFPEFIRKLEPRNERFIPVAWAVNGIFSVAASNLGAILYLFLGANSVVVMGLACYALLGLTASVLSPPAGSGAAPATNRL
jgi:MFS family permease